MMQNFEGKIITNNNNFAGANVVIQQVNGNEQGLFKIARREY